MSFFLTVLYLNFNETPQPSLRELEKMIKEIEVSEINEKDNSEEMEREQYINDIGICQEIFWIVLRDILMNYR